MENQTSKFTAKLISVAKTPSVSATGTQFRRCTVEYKSPATGELKQSSARIWEKNYAYGMQEGESYSATAQVWLNAEGNAQVDITVSHLQNATSASLADFGFTAPVPADLNAVG
jgi:hypothetical protein